MVIFLFPFWECLGVKMCLAKCAFVFLELILLDLMVLDYQIKINNVTTYCKNDR